MIQNLIRPRATDSTELTIFLRRYDNRNLTSS
jgi:hypothetical protein